MRGLLLLVGLGLLSGCGARPNTAPVVGKVQMKGQPVTAGSIWFHADGANPWKGEKPSCQLQLDGSFTMRTYPYGPGVPPGAYKVTLSPELASRLGKPRYADPGTTPWSVEVPTSGIAEQVFEVH
ncbi:MAG: hypothetical protein U0840_10525 [Gemmataceae bacterium]